MKHQPLFLLAATSLLSTAALAQQPLSQEDLLKQIEALQPNRPATTKNEPRALPSPLFDPALSDTPKPGGDRKDKTAEKKAKGPTEITAVQAVTFDNKANVAVFVGDVVVKDPDFNCMCDKLTAHLKKKAPANPNATPAPNGASGKSGGGGLEKAIAESTSERRVILTQEKVEPDGSITHSLGKANRAEYDAASGDIYLHGSPEVTQGPQRMTALTPETIIIINRDGKLRSQGPTKSVIIDQSKDR